MPTAAPEPVLASFELKPRGLYRRDLGQQGTADADKRSFWKFSTQINNWMYTADSTTSLHLRWSPSLLDYSTLTMAYTGWHKTRTNATESKKLSAWNFAKCRSDFRNHFTMTLASEFLIKLSQKIPQCLNRFATLSREISGTLFNQWLMDGFCVTL